MVTFMLVLLSVPVGPGAPGSSVIPALAPPLVAGRGCVHECGSPWAELRLRLHVVPVPLPAGTLNTDLFE